MKTCNIQQYIYTTHKCSFHLALRVTVGPFWKLQMSECKLAVRAKVKVNVTQGQGQGQSEAKITHQGHLFYTSQGQGHRDT